MLPPGECDCFSLNGGSLSIAQPLGASHLAALFDAAVEHGSGIGSSGYDLTLTSIASGIRYRPFRQPRWNPFAQVLIGVANASGTLVEGNTPAASDSTLNFASIVGGGLDYRLRGRWSLRLIDADYLLTRSSTALTIHQNNLRLGAGIVIRLGSIELQAQVSRNCGAFLAPPGRSISGVPVCPRVKPYLTRSRSFLARSAFACVLICSILNIRLATAQSLKLDAPAPLHQGNNQALIDSFVGDHYYYFYELPLFHIAWTFSGTVKAST